MEFFTKRSVAERWTKFSASQSHSSHFPDNGALSGLVVERWYLENESATRFNRAQEVLLDVLPWRNHRIDANHWPRPKRSLLERCALQTPRRLLGFRSQITKNIAYWVHLHNHDPVLCAHVVFDLVQVTFRCFFAWWVSLYSAKCRRTVQAGCCDRNTSHDTLML